VTGPADPLGALFQPLQLGALTLRNRVIMAPLTRARATPGNVPTAMMAQYYAQRADCGLIVSEATAVDPLGMGWYRVPGLWSDAMVAGWTEVTSAVHAAGGGEGAGKGVGGGVAVALAGAPHVMDRIAFDP
jgi:2,4-dienoyl-CoA reductase-like NADH-dependent reductase (Old Yellow Enzyme family)